MPMAANHNNHPNMEQHMPWIGKYVALASLACSLAMAADAAHGFRSKKLWFPSKYFSLNTTSLTLLGVALKLPIDLTTPMWAATDRLAKISSLALMTTAMANFMPSLGSMSDKDILINVTALGILVFTVVVDVCIQVACPHHPVFLPEEIIAMSLMLLLLLVLGSSVIMILTTKRILEAKYQEMHNETLSQEVSDMGEVTADKLRDLVKKYWVMAETSNPQFVIARSATCATSGVICLANALVLAQAIVRTAVARKSLSLTDSSYGSSTKWILLAQTIGVVVGTIITSFRWYTAIRFRCSSAVRKSLKDNFKVEDYWTRGLKEYKGSSLSSRIRHHKCRRLLYNARGLVVKLIVRAQILIVLFKKLVLVVSCFITGPLVKFIERESVSGDFIVQSFNSKSLRLEGEAEMPDYTLKCICKVDEVISTSRKQKPLSLLQLLQKKSCNFKGVAQFDSDRVPRLHHREPKNCWSLPVVTLTSIAIALPNIAKSRVDQLVSDVRDGLFLVKIIEKSLYQNREWKNIRKAAKFWLGVDLFRKWQEIDLREVSLRSSNAKEVLKSLAAKSKEIASELRTDVDACPFSNPVNWHARIIAAYSMYRISNTILLACDEESALTDEELFERLSVMIADMLAACLTNLPRVITTKCHLNSIEDRRKSVHQAAHLLGKTEEVIEFLGQCQLQAGINAEQAPHIEEWRKIMLVKNVAPSDVINSSSIETTSESGSNCSRVSLTSPEVSFQYHAQSCQTIAEFSISCNHQHREEVSVRLVPAPTTSTGTSITLTFQNTNT